MNTPVTFRFAEKKDTPLILSFIKELAEYEHLTDQVVTDEALLSEWIFEKRKAEVLFVVTEGIEAGFALFFHNFSTFLGRAGIYLEDLFVKEEFRGRGCGKALLKELARITLERGCGRLEWSCLNWNTPSIQFYRSLGAQPMDEWTVYRLAGKTLEQCAAQNTGIRQPETGGLSQAQLHTIETYTRSAAAFESKIAQLPNYDSAYRDFSHLIPPGGSLLDLACGPANASQKISSYAPVPLRITGIDLSDGMLELARRNIPEGTFIKQSIIAFSVKPDASGQDECTGGENCSRGACSGSCGIPFMFESPDCSGCSGFSAAVNAFGLPYLTPEQAEQSLRSTFRALAPRGVLYLSFMEGSGSRMETTSFCPDTQMQIQYHREHDIRQLLEKTGFSVISARHIPYTEPDGSVTADVILFCRKGENEV